MLSTPMSNCTYQWQSDGMNFSSIMDERKISALGNATFGFGGEGGLWSSDLPSISNSTSFESNTHSSHVVASMDTPCQIDTWQPSGSVKDELLSSADENHQSSGTALNNLPVETCGSSRKSESNESIPDSPSGVGNSNGPCQTHLKLTTKGPDQAEKQHKIHELVNSVSGWASQNVNQSTEWDTKDLREKSTDPKTESNVWCSGPPNGVSVWEDYYESVGVHTSRWHAAASRAQQSGSTEPSTSTWDGSAEAPRNFTTAENGIRILTRNPDAQNANRLPLPKIANLGGAPQAPLTMPMNTNYVGSQSRTETSTRAVYLDRLKAMGFSATAANDALIRSDMNWEKALAILASQAPSNTMLPGVVPGGVSAMGSAGGVSGAMSGVGSNPQQQQLPPQPLQQQQQSTNANIAQLRNTLQSYQQTMQTFLNQEKNILIYMNECKRRIQDYSQRIVMNSRMNMSNPQMTQSYQVEMMQSQQQLNKLEEMLKEVRTRAYTLRQQMMQVQVELQQQSRSTPVPVPNVSLLPTTSSSSLSIGNAMNANNVGSNVISGMLPTVLPTVLSSTGGVRTAPYRAMMNYTSPSVPQSIPSSIPPSVASVQNGAFRGAVPGAVGGAMSYAPVPAQRSLLTLPPQDPEGYGNPMWSAADNLSSQLEQVKLQHTMPPPPQPTPTNVLNEVAEFVPGQRWSGLKDDVTPGHAKPWNVFTVQTDHLESLAQSPNDAEHPSAAVSVETVPTADGGQLYSEQSSMVMAPFSAPRAMIAASTQSASAPHKWIFLPYLPAPNNHAIEQFLMQLQMQVMKMPPTNVLLLRYHWHPQQKWLLVAMPEDSLYPCMQLSIMSNARLVPDHEAAAYVHMLKQMEQAQ